MENLGDVDVQSVAGAVATGTHGTGRSLQSLSARMSGLRLLLADASLRVVTQERTPELLRAARVSLGALGVITAVRFDLVPAYRLHERVWRAPIETCLAELDARVAATRHFEFFWFPRDDVAEMKSLDPTDAPEGAPAEGERIGWSARVLPSVREVRFFEMEYAVPREAGPACFRAVRERMQRRHERVAWPVEYRTVAADDAWLSPFFERDSVTISLHQDGRKPYAEFFADVEPIFWEHGGRPHWGKVHGLGAEALRRLYPRFDDFLATRASLDPAGRFTNAALRELLGG
jgi:FAD/FMN-containing dehydrogenase